LRPPGRQAATMQPCVKDGNVMVLAFFSGIPQI